MTKKQYSIIGIFAPILFWTFYFTLANQKEGYSYLTKAISELGSINTPNKWLWNTFGYIIPGGLISVFGYGLFKHLAVKNSSKTPLFGIVFSGIFMALSGFFPGDFENKQSLTMLLHSVGSFGSYISFLLAAFTFPSLMKTSSYWKSAIRPSLMFTWLTIIFGTWPFIFPNTPAAGQRIVFAFYFIWIGFNALKLNRMPKHI
ncbi:MAG: DUF998 domain-containing protein [Bacteroidia bacterium]